MSVIDPVVAPPKKKENVKKGLIESYEGLLQEKKISMDHPIWEECHSSILPEERKSLIDFLQGLGSDEDEKFKKRLTELGVSPRTQQHYLGEYKKLLPLIKFGHFREKNGIPEDHAIQLILAFGTKETAVQYLKKFERLNLQEKQIVHEACQFSLPKAKWNFNVWQTLADKYMPDDAFKAALGRGDEIETYVDKHRAELEQSIQTTIGRKWETKLLEEYEGYVKLKLDMELGEVAYIQKKMEKKRWDIEKDLKRKLNFKASEILGFSKKQKPSEAEKKQIDAYCLSAEGIKQKTEIRGRLFRECEESIRKEYQVVFTAIALGREGYIAKRLKEENKRIKEEVNLRKYAVFSKTTDLATLKSYCAKLLYERGDENPEAAIIFSQQGMSNQAFNTYLGLVEQDSDRIPPLLSAGEPIPILVDGIEIRHAGYYLTKLQGPRAAVAGKMTGCCQHLDHEDGGQCFIHGFTSKEGGFYGLCKRKPGKPPSANDPIVAQCWAWRSKNGMLVFDSIEMTSHYRDDEHQQMIWDFFSFWAQQLIDKYNIPRVLVGAGQTPRKLGSLMPLANEWPLDYPASGYRDSQLKQRIIADRILPFLEYKIFLDYRLRHHCDKFSSKLFPMDVEIKIKREELEQSLMEWCDIVAFNEKHPNFKNEDFSFDSDVPSVPSVLSSAYAFPLYCGRYVELFSSLGIKEHQLKKRFLLTIQALPLLNKGQVPGILKRFGQNISSSLRGWMNFKRNWKDSSRRYGNGKTILMLACERDFEEQFDMVLSRTKEIVHEKDDFSGRTALMLASHSGNLRAVRALLEQTSARESINEKDINDNTALKLVFFGKDNEFGDAIVEMLLKYNAAVDFETLSLAIDHNQGNGRIVEALLNAGGKEFVNMKTERGTTLLMMASSQDAGIVAALLKAGAGKLIHERNALGKSAWACAFINGNMEVVALLNKELARCAKEQLEVLKSPEQQDSYGRTSLMYTAASGDIKKVSELLKTETTVSLKKQDIDGRNALMLAAENGEARIVQVLVEAYAFWKIA